MQLTNNQISQIITGLITIFSVLLGGFGSLTILWLKNKNDIRIKRKNILLEKTELLYNYLNDFTLEFSNFPNIKPALSFESVINHYTDLLFKLEAYSNKIIAILDIYLTKKDEILEIEKTLFECIRFYKTFFNKLRDVYRNTTDDNKFEDFKNLLLHDNDQVNKKLIELQKAKKILSIYIHEKYFNRKVIYKKKKSKNDKSV